MTDAPLGGKVLITINIQLLYEKASNFDYAAA